MKHLINFSALLILLTTAKATEYTPFKVRDSQWRYEFRHYTVAYDSNGVATPGYQISLYDYYLGETRQNLNLSYRDVFVKGNSYFDPVDESLPTYNWGAFNNYIGSFREDTLNKKVYIIGRSQTLPAYEIPLLWYDFDVAVGDTLLPTIQTQSNTYYVESIDSVLVDNHWRRRINLNGNTKESYVEGIGSMKDLIEPYGLAFEWIHRFICYKENNEAVYVKDSALCLEGTTAILEEDLPIISVYPNPVQQGKTVKISGREGIFDVEIYSLTGELVAKILSSGTINTELFTPGIYLAKIQGQWEQMPVTKKLIVN